MREYRQESEWIQSSQRSLSQSGDAPRICALTFSFCSGGMLSQNLPECALSELLYADDSVLLSESIEGLSKKLLKWKEAFESKGLERQWSRKKSYMMKWKL